MSEFTHINASGEAIMVDVSEKTETSRVAKAQALVQVNQQTVDSLLNGEQHKGDVFACARIAGIQAAKKTSELIPLCHPLMLSKVTVDLSVVCNGLPICWPNLPLSGIGYLEAASHQLNTIIATS